MAASCELRVEVRQLDVPCEPFRLVSRLWPRGGLSFLESSAPGGRCGEFSIVCFSPFMILKAKGRKVERARRPQMWETVHEDPFSALQEALSAFSVVEGPDFIPFAGGAIGYFGYDLARIIERLPRIAVDDLRFPDMYFSFYRSAVVFSHKTGKVYVISLTEPGKVSQSDALREKIQKVYDERESEGDEGEWGWKEGESAASGSLERRVVTGNFSRRAYMAAVRRVKDYIKAGDIFQANLSQRFECTISFCPFELYARLRRENPAPFSAFLDSGSSSDGMPIAVVSSSPERFLKLSHGRVETRPIKGTRPRGKTIVEDEQLKEDLLRSEKDDAELTMIVDLERNDIGKVCEFGSVKVTEPKVVETYPTVHHLVATVEGTLRSDCSPVELVKACFPGGSITGAPKVRAMEIIEELEPTRRNVYTGAIGYIGFDGQMDLSIAIRTILVKGRKAYLQVGGGIIVDSDPALEYEETLHKAQGMFRALGLVGLDKQEQEE